MADVFGATRIVTPDGVEWRVGRRWMTRRFRRSWRWRRDTGIDLLASGGFSSGDWAGGGLEEAALVLVAVVVVALVLVPVLLFGVELIVVGCVLSVSLAGRVLLGRPWTVEARSPGFAGHERRLEWSVPGWRRSGKVINEIAEDLAAGREPAPTSTQLV